METSTWRCQSSVRNDDSLQNPHVFSREMHIYYSLFNRATTDPKETRAVPATFPRATLFLCIPAAAAV